ncbi:histidine kinase [Spirosoma sp. KCTC 42546]|uniref:ATP-binding protein n=1 Tax=Spirosoma sp. KCTC 42546 TaxID=2520506 RepID=UPI00115A13B4|nr:ATP-binding protein [Spirosoma sp. KCTC 42546]QDK77932.1 histidine kinase [Spirosoma sp. KCTC 42546]
MKSVSTPTRLLHNTDEFSPANGVVLYHAQRDPDGQLIDFRLVMLNDPASTMWGRPQLELVGRSLSQLVADNDAQYLIRQFSLVVEFGRSVRFRMDDSWKQAGTTRQYDLLVVKLDDGVLVTYDDLTASKQADLQAQRDKLYQNSIYQQVIDNTQAGLLLARPIRDEHNQIIDFQYVLTNEYNARITGRSVAEMTGALVGDLFAGWQESDLFRRYVDAVETKQLSRITFFYESYGIKGWFDGSFSCVDDCLLYTYIDVTAYKEAELVQQQNADLLEQVMNMTPAALVMNKSIRNEAGEIIDLRMMKLNQMAADILQNPIEKIQYRRISKYMPGSLETPLFEQCKQVIETGIPRRVEVPWADRWYDFSVARFGDGIVLAAQDSTPMHQYQHQLERANIELKRSNENLQSFAFVASHDLQEPLRKIISFSDILDTQYASQFDTATADIVSRINASAIRMRLLIQDLLAYSQVETHQDSFVPVTIASLIQELQEHELWETIHQRKAQIQLGKLPVIMADLLQMRQLFQNILSNAIKFCPIDTTPVITVSSRLIERSNVPSGLLLPAKSEKTKPANSWFSEISITDNGIGFDEKYLDRIFQVFQRLNGRSQYAGSGIGLAISQKIVERHGGAITANSQPGRGSTFQVYLPVQKEV